MNPKITVFTPSFNRAYIIGKLYESLCRQTFKNFEWLVVDDGSTDDTAALLAKFSAEGKIRLRYFKQANGGKHRAINHGVREAQGSLFFIVDSDDYLADNALERLDFYYEQIKENQDFCGVSGLRAFPSGEKIGGECSSWKILDCNCLDFRYQHKVRGDMAEAFKTSVMREFPFPEIDGERFCPESVVWNRMAQKYKLRYFYEKIYFCEYLPDGLTASSVRSRRASPESAMLTYADMLRFPRVPVAQKIKAAINFWRFAFASKRRFFDKLKQAGAGTLPFVLAGFAFFLRDGKIAKK